ncbi:Radical SAM superfamily protein [Desulfonispora thiosulfatigenes DSM 11270]|uniref:Radical SAM superfamily protein n=1 Tax=Desulfonispora thiosulfatigenes DSM 11270 TaxID=656914 RepID=A0A1W1VJY9_DESTI|nr:radical SAM protein [Desulfonispora thiosulfatigenes]SMB93636.1 Radical SAM superfamily protein [Desulfonispora thiosulfatigenes DSM 11270]
MKTLVIPIFIPHLGCPHTCVFCNQRKIAGISEIPTKEMISKITTEFLNTLNNEKKYYLEIAFYGGSFTGIKAELQEEYLSEANALLKQGIINGIRLSTRPDYINEKVIERLTRYQVTTVELGVQSLDEEVLLKSERGHKGQVVEKAVSLLKKAKIKVGIQLMPGLPGDTPQKVLDTTKRVLNLKPDMVRIYPTVVIKDTKLAEMYQEKEYTPWSLDEVIEVAAEMLILFSQKKINVIRIGLQATENLHTDKDLIAGPFHPAMGELVKARVFRKQIENIFRQIDNISQEINLYCYPGELSQVKGQKNQNITFLQEKYITKINVLPQKELEKGSLMLIDEKEKTYLSLREEFLVKYTEEVLY